MKIVSLTPTPLRHLNDFVRQPTILNCFLRDRALLAFDACAGRDNAGIDAHPMMAQAQNAIVRSVRPDTYCSGLKNYVAALSVVSGAIRFGVAKDRLWRQAAVRTQTFGPRLIRTHHFETKLGKGPTVSRTSLRRVGLLRDIQELDLRYRAGQKSLCQPASVAFGRKE
jgi:hypothetical protein